MKNISRGCVVRRWKKKIAQKNDCAARVFLTSYDASEWDFFRIKNNQLIILFIIRLTNITIFNFSFESRNEKGKVVSKLRQEVKVNVDIVTSDDIKIYYTVKFQDFTAGYIINPLFSQSMAHISWNTDSCDFIKFIVILSKFKTQASIVVLQPPVKYSPMTNDNHC